jgi:PAS domain S-box-containing protein
MTGDPESVRQIVQTKQPLVSNLFVSLVVKKPVFNVSIPLLRDGEVSYVMSLGMLPDHLSALLAEQKLGSEWVSLVWDRKNIVLARSEDNLRYTGKTLPNDWREPGPGAVVQTTNLDGVDVLQASKRSPLSGWGVAVNVPFALVTSEMRRSVMLWGLASIVAISVAGFSGMFFARQITTSLSAATQAAVAFGQGASFPLRQSSLKEANDFLVTLRDAHEAREQLTQELRQNRDWLQTTLNSIGDGVITTDCSGNVTLLNPVAQSLTGWTQEEAAGRPLDQVFVIRNAETRLEVENPAFRALREGQIVGLANHTMLIAKDGAEIPIDDSAAPIRDDDTVAGAVLIFRDISERNRAEGHLRASNAALSRANEDLSQFAFAAGHDLQEPLRMIASYSQLLLRRYRGHLDGEAETCIRFITEGTTRMGSLLADLLAYTRVTGKGKDGEPIEDTATVDLNRVLQAVLENCRTAIAETDAIVTSAPLPRVRGHETHFLQLLQNLISNALKYRGDRPPRIHVDTERQNGWWRIAVMDNGIGIAPEYHKLIFGVFKRLHGRSIPGTGIGLAICQRVVERYDGQIWVESEPGNGATFFFTLPAETKAVASA